MVTALIEDIGAATASLKIAAAVVHSNAVRDRSKAMFDSVQNVPGSTIWRWGMDTAMDVEVEMCTMEMEMEMGWRWRWRWRWGW